MASAVGHATTLEDILTTRAVRKLGHDLAGLVALSWRGNLLVLFLLKNALPCRHFLFFLFLSAASRLFLVLVSESADLALGQVNSDSLLNLDELRSVLLRALESLLLHGRDLHDFDLSVRLHVGILIVFGIGVLGIAIAATLTHIYLIYLLL